MDTPLSPETNAAITPLDVQVEKIRTSGILGRSSQLQRLFDYLYTCHLAGKSPKEFEIAVEGLGRGDDFDVTQDALVRVYIHKLRRKLQDYYQDAGKDELAHLAVPKGEYRLVLVAARDDKPLPADDGDEELAPTPTPEHRRRLRGPFLIGLAISLLLNLLLVGRWAIDGPLSPEGRVCSSSLWQPLFADDRPITLVVGDYYIFAEADERETVRRLVRDFDINGPMDLATYLQTRPKQASRVFDVGLSYIPTSAGYALTRLGAVLSSQGKKPRVLLASELTQEVVRNSHIVYVGHLSGLGPLADTALNESGFRVGSSYDELIDRKSGQRYFSSSGIPQQGGNAESHLAYLSAFPGPSGNRIIVIAGFRDPGLRELSEVVTSPAGLSELSAGNSSQAYEAIYQTSGVGLATTPAKLILARPFPKN